MKTKITLLIAFCGMVAIVSGALGADETRRNILLQRDQPFKGKVGLRPKESVKDFPKDVGAPKGAPNVLLILTDDVGFGASRTFGGPVPTPTFDRVANNGATQNFIAGGCPHLEREAD